MDSDPKRLLEELTRSEIRMIVPPYSLRHPEDPLPPRISPYEKQDLIMIYGDSEPLKLLRINMGREILREATRGLCGTPILLPFANTEHNPGVRKFLSRVTSTALPQERITENDFRPLARSFLQRQMFSPSRDKPTTLVKFLDESGGNPMTNSGQTSERLEEAREDLRTNLLQRITLLYLPDNPLLAAHDVRLYNSLSSCIVRDNEVEAYQHHRSFDRFPLTTPDAVLVYAQNRVAIVYLVTDDTKPERNRGKLLHERLSKAGLFFSNSFGTDTLLVRAQYQPDTDQMYEAAHFRLDNGRLWTVREAETTTRRVRLKAPRNPETIFQKEREY